MLTISQVARRFGLSRSTLLYYDRLNLVRPTYRTAAGYRLYAEEDEACLRQVCQYRKAGLPLADIAQLLDHPEGHDGVVDALERRLAGLNDEIASLRRQQHVVIQLLGRRGRRAKRVARALTKAGWIKILRSAGMNEPDMRQWHIAFEVQSPAAHQDFLESLGIPAPEVKRIRKWSAAGAKIHGASKVA